MKQLMYDYRDGIRRRTPMVGDFVRIPGRKGRADVGQVALVEWDRDAAAPDGRMAFVQVRPCFVLGDAVSRWRDEWIHGMDNVTVEGGEVWTTERDVEVLRAECGIDRWRPYVAQLSQLPR